MGGGGEDDGRAFVCQAATCHSARASTHTDAQSAERRARRAPSRQGAAPWRPIASKMWSNAAGVMPRSSGGSSFPSIVNDLPVPVWP